MVALQIICLLIIGLFCLAILSVSIVFIYLTVSAGFMHSSPAVPSHGKVKNAIISEASSLLQNSSGKVIMDLGSGWGTLLLPLAKKFPNHKFIGIERGYLPFNVSVWRARKLKNLTFLRQDFFKTDIGDADLIFVFLLTSTMAQLTAKIKTEMKPDSIVIANRFPMKDEKPYKEVSLGSKYYTYYVYKN
jgi:precorrin-6B methylase 2